VDSSQESDLAHLFWRYEQRLKLSEINSTLAAWAQNFYQKHSGDQMTLTHQIDLHKNKK
jgi:hypothetical protein